VLRGLSTRAIAEELAIAPSTVQAHLTSIFGKTGLRSRRELVNRLRG
jgi:DNA-binding CsgD family transcriptional regulator